MKRIIEGVTYDTDTATEVFSAGGLTGDMMSVTHWHLFQTRHGAFFKVVCEPDGDTFQPLTDREAQKILERHANDLVEQYFGAMPEYGSAEKRLTLRMPIGLYRRVENSAAAHSLDVNKYIQRCLERATTANGAGVPK
jgi:predicted DNA binding CopG/RHH family protein